MPKITVHGGSSHAGTEPQPATEPVEEPQPTDEAEAEPDDDAESAPEVPAEDDASAYSDLSFRDLRRVLRERGLSSKGTADELRARLAEADEVADGESKAHDQDELKQRLDAS